MCGTQTGTQPAQRFFSAGFRHGGDGQPTEVMQRSAMTNPDYDWSGQKLIAHDLLGHDPTDASMLNAHFGEHAPLYIKAIEQFNASPSAEHFNAIVTACSQCHLGTCPGPLERIEKRRVTLD